VVRELVPGLGDLRREFDFSQRPRRPLVLPRNPGRDASRAAAVR
jgi:hypothetical protein